MKAIVRSARLEEPGMGIAFSLPVDRFVESIHLAAPELSEEPKP